MVYGYSPIDQCSSYHNGCHNQCWIKKTAACRWENGKISTFIPRPRSDLKTAKQWWSMRISLSAISQMFSINLSFLSLLSWQIGMGTTHSSLQRCRIFTLIMPVSERWTMSSSNPVRSPFGVNWTLPVIPSKEIYGEKHQFISLRWISIDEGKTWLNFECNSMPKGQPRPSEQEIFGRIISTPSLTWDAINLS